MKLISTAVEEWAKEFECCKKRSLSNDEIGIFISATIANENINSDKWALEYLEKNSMAAVVYKRVKHCHTYTITPAVALLSEVVVNNNFGNSTMLCAYMQYKAHQLGLKTIDVKEFCLEIIPYGIPTDDEFRRLWDLQKLDPEILKERKSGFESDNGLDYKITYESIIKRDEETDKNI